MPATSEMFAEHTAALEDYKDAAEAHEAEQSQTSLNEMIAKYEALARKYEALVEAGA